MPRATWQLLREAAASWLDDYAPSMGAALAFYSLFSIAPLLLIVTSLVGWVFGAEAARGELLAQLSGLIGEQNARTVESLVLGLDRPFAGAVGTSVGLVIMLIGATTVFAELRDALDRIWRSPAGPARSSGSVWAFLRVRLLSLGLILAIGFLLIVSLVISAAMSALGKWWAPWFGEVAMLANALNTVVSFALLCALFAAIYKWMPRVRVAWRDVAMGAMMTSLLFEVGRTLIGLYIGRSGVASPFGAAASPVVLMLWVYYSAQIFLFGAELTWVYARRYGSLRGRPAASAAPAASRRWPPGAAPAPALPSRSGTGRSTAAPGSSSPATD